MARPTIEVCSASRANSGLFLVNFTNGQLKPEEEEGVCAPRFACYQSTIAHKQHERTLVCEAENLQYIGHNTGPEAPRSTALCKYMVAAHNRRTGKVTLYNSELFSLTPHFPDEEKESKDQTDMSFSERIDDLTSAFGSIRKRRAMESRIRNKIEGDSLDSALTSVVEGVLASPDGDNLAAKPSVQNDRAGIPPFDKEATDPAGVYSLDSVISPPEYQAMEGAAQILIDSNKDTVKEWREQLVYPKYILDLLSMLPFEPEARKHRAICLLYLHYLMKMFHLQPRDLKRKDVLPSEVPKIVQTTVLSHFTIQAIVPGRKQPNRCMPARLKDKLLAYICVLCLILEDFSIDFGPLLTDLKVSQQRMINTLRSLGCNCKMQKVDYNGISMNVGTASLTVPLTFPEVITKTPKGRR